MKVLQINSVCGIGSTGRIATDIHKILEDQGHESWIAYGRGEAKNCKNTIKIGSNIDNYQHVAKTRIFDRHGFGSAKATEVFIEKVKKLDPDVIHLHNIHGYYINIEILFSYLKESGKKVIWTLHDCWAFTGHCAYFDYVNCDKWKIQCKKCPQKESYPASKFKDNSSKNFDSKKEIFNGVENLTIVTPSNWLARLVKKSFLGNYPVEVINNGIDLITFTPKKSIFRKKYNLEEKLVVLGVANVWEERKGLKYFIELAKKIESNKIIVLVGLTDQQINELPKNIIGIKKTNSITELAELYSSANVFFNPTLEDNFPTTNLESLACGTPVITYNTGGSSESVDDFTGKVVNVGEIEEVLYFLNKLSDLNESEKEEMNLNCRKKAVSNYSKDDRFNDYIGLYF